MAKSSIDPKSLSRFEALFSGAATCYNRFIPDLSLTGPGEKAKGKTFRVHKPVTTGLFLKHLMGEESIGIIPVFGDRCRFSVLDIDIYPLNPTKYLDIIDHYHLPVCLFKSKSGGIHAFVFWERDTLADKAIAMMQELRSFFGLPASCEIFPKQAKATESEGNAINLPYFALGRFGRYMYGQDGKKLPFAAMLSEAWGKRTSLLAMKKKLQDLPLADAPPCLQSLFVSKAVDKGNRNVFLFNCGVYYKQKEPTDFIKYIEELNSNLPFPLDKDELYKTVIASLQKDGASYSYQCNDAHLSGRCMKKACLTRAFGKNALDKEKIESSTGMTFGRLIQVQADPPFYKWTVNGKTLPFFSEESLRRQESFLDLCMRHLHVLPQKMKQDEWYKILGHALERMEYEAAPESVATIDLWKAYFCEYLGSRSMATSVAQIPLGLVYIDEQGYWFKAEAFTYWLQKIKGFKGLSSSEQYYQLHELGIKGMLKEDPLTKKSFACAFFSHEKLEALAEKRYTEGSQERESATFVRPKEDASAGSWARSAEHIQELLDKLDDVPTEDFTPEEESESER